MTGLRHGGSWPSRREETPERYGATPVFKAYPASDALARLTRRPSALTFAPLRLAARPPRPRRAPSLGRQSASRAPAAPPERGDLQTLRRPLAHSAPCTDPRAPPTRGAAANPDPQVDHGRPEHWSRGCIRRGLPRGPPRRESDCLQMGTVRLGRGPRRPSRRARRGRASNASRVGRLLDGRAAGFPPPNPSTAPYSRRLRACRRRAEAICQRGRCQPPSDARAAAWRPRRRPTLPSLDAPAPHLPAAPVLARPTRPEPVA
jgi:hypothetical protein